MVKLKYLITILFASVLLLVIPNISNAADELTYSDKEQGIEWEYELDDGDNVINLRCKTTSVTGSVTIPSTIDGKTVTSLAGNYSYSDGAFKDCAGLSGVTIPNTITKIGAGAFYNCTGLKNVTMPDSVTSIGQYAFYKCSGLTSVTFSKKLTSIGRDAFEGCTGLRSVTIPDSVTTIEESAFQECSGIKELTLSKNLSKISYDTFYKCTGLTSVKLPESVTTIEGEYGGAFGKCTGLTKILIPDNVASIGDGAFQGCEKLTIYGNKGSTAQTYAKEKGIPFNYISNWDKTTGLEDITAPIVKSMEIRYASVMGYWSSTAAVYQVPEGKQIIIDVTFSEKIQGTTAPTLKIKCGTGTERTIKNGVIGDDTITYTYKIQSGDKGIIRATSYSGGNVTDLAGNKATLSVKDLDVSGFDVYANGSVKDIEEDKKPSGGDSSGGASSSKDNNEDKKTTGGSSSKDNNDNKKPNSGSSSSSSDKGNTNTDKASTNKPSKLPYTGVGVTLTITAIIMLVSGAIAYIKYNNLKGI